MVLFALLIVWGRSFAWARGVVDPPARAAYAGIRERKGGGLEAVVRAGRLRLRAWAAKGSSLPAWLDRLADQHHLKIVAAALAGPKNTPALRIGVWKRSDVWMPRQTNGRTAEALAAEAEGLFESGHTARVPIDAFGRIQVKERAAALEDYRPITSPTLFRRVMKGLAWAREAHLDLVIVGSTSRGGGVARMRHPMVAHLNEAGVPTTWLAMPADPEIFAITKKRLHNAFQDVGDDADHLQPADVAKLRAWTDRAFRGFPPGIFAAVPGRRKVVIIDDYQPSGLIPLIRRENPDALILFRAHTQIRSDLVAEAGSRSAAAWDYVRGNLGGADRFIFHPIPGNIPFDIAEAWKPKIVGMRATGDPLDGLYKPLDARARRHFRARFNQLLEAQGQTPLDPARPYLHQNARFDPSKGIPDVIRSFALLRERLAREGRPLPQLVLAGFGSVDDVEGNEVYEATRRLLTRPELRALAHDVKVVRLDPEDQLMNFVRKESRVALQLSRGRQLKGAEGWEDEVSAARMDGKPVIVYDQGGPPRQIRSGTGYVVKTGDVETVADRLHRLFTDEALYARMSARTARVSEQATHFANMANWLRLIEDATQGRTPDRGVLEAGILRKAERPPKRPFVSPTI